MAQDHNAPVRFSAVFQDSTRPGKLPPKSARRYLIREKTKSARERVVIQSGSHSTDEWVG